MGPTVPAAHRVRLDRMSIVSWLALGAVSLLVVVAVHDLTQKKHAILRNFPLIGHGRYWLEVLGPPVRQYFIAKNDEARYEIYQKMDAILVDELPVIPSFYYTKVAAVSSRIKGFYPTLLDNHPYKYVYLED